MGEEIVRLGAGRAIQYALRDPGRGLDDVPVYRVAADGTLRRLGILIPVRPDGFVMRQEDGATLYSAGLPWWLVDMRPQGFLGRAYAKRHAAALGLPPRLAEWTDSHALRALIAHGEDLVGNLLLGDLARERFLNATRPVSVDRADYPALSRAAARGELPGSSAGGEQPKFVTFTDRHLLVKFSAADDNPVSQRWRDLLAAEQLAAQVLLDAGIPASRSQIFDIDGQRFLEIERFDRVGETGRRALHSLASLDAEFVGNATLPWPLLAEKLRAQGVISQPAAEQASLLYAFGTLIGNTDMHHGNLSFVGEHGRPYELAPAYDMLPMAFAPSSGGALPTELSPARLHPGVKPEIWRQALSLAEAFVSVMSRERWFADAWLPCRNALGQHLANAREKIGRLG